MMSMRRRRRTVMMTVTGRARNRGKNTEEEKVAA